MVFEWRFLKKVSKWIPKLDIKVMHNATFEGSLSQQSGINHTWRLVFFGHPSFNFSSDVFGDNEI